MPIRQTVFAENEYYHVYNRGVNKRKIFLKPHHYHRAIETLKYYLFSDHKVRFSYYNRWGTEQKQKYIDSLSNSNVSLVAYVLMPNHFHFLLSQTGNNGITDCLRLFENSYTRYFNTATKRIGPLLQGRFKAVHIETDEQLQHVVRYIHLNPYTSRLVDKTKDLATYPWSSYPSYLHNSIETQLQDEIIMSQFESVDYEDFVSEQGEYQRQLDEIKHLVLE